MGVVGSVLLLLLFDYLPGGVWGWLVLGILCGVVLFSFALQLVVFVAALIRRRWWTAVGTIFTGVLNLGVFALFPLMVFHMVVGTWFDLEADDFGSRHPIPEGMEYCAPLGYGIEGHHAAYAVFDYPPEEPVIDSADSRTWLQIWNDNQGGRYLFDLYYGALPDGEVYLRCFENTENVELSKDAMKRNTHVKVRCHNGFGKLVDKKDFVIYEGDWEDYYAVRVEVWHKDAATGRRQKLLQKVYRMEGWMR